MGREGQHNNKHITTTNTSQQQTHHNNKHITLPFIVLVLAVLSNVVSVVPENNCQTHQSTKEGAPHCHAPAVFHSVSLWRSSRSKIGDTMTMLCFFAICGQGIRSNHAVLSNKIHTLSTKLRFQCVMSGSTPHSSTEGAKRERWNELGSHVREQ